MNAYFVIDVIRHPENPPQGLLFSIEFDLAKASTRAEIIQGVVLEVPIAVDGAGITR